MKVEDARKCEVRKRVQINEVRTLKIPWEWSSNKSKQKV